MLPDENDGTGEETANETSQKKKKSHVLAGRCGSAELNSPGFRIGGIVTSLTAAEASILELASSGLKQVVTGK